MEQQSVIKRLFHGASRHWGNQWRMVQYPWAGSSGILCHPLDLPEAAKQDSYWNSERTAPGRGPCGRSHLGHQWAETNRERAQKTHICLLSDLPPKPLIGWVQLEPEGEEAKWDSPCRSDSPRHRAGRRRVERGQEMASSQHSEIGHSWVRIQCHLLLCTSPTKPVSGAGCSGPTSFPRIHAAWLFFRGVFQERTLVLNLLFTSS